ncbi:MAG: alpha/beta fold hydrolase [Armatimonadetes bacterium]|nr:alpha/beta fold hydrolase [Armatimonadota bacterium]
MIRWCLLLALGGLLFGWPKPATAAVDQSKRAALFAYDASQPLAVQVRRTRRHGTITEQDITFASPKGGRVTATLMVPEGAGPFAGIILLHGATGSRHSLRRGARLLCAAGAVCLLPDAPYCGDRAEAGKRLVDISNPAEMRAGVIRAVVELRRCVDLLLARPDVDAKRLAFIGSSLGGSVGGILAGVEKRIAAYALLVASGSWHEAALKSQNLLVKLARLTLSKETIARAADILAEVDPIHYVPHAAPAALLFQNGKRDTTTPVSCAQDYQDAGSQPKECRWYDAGHDLNIEAFMERAQWLREKIGIGPVEKPTRLDGLNH